MSQDVNEFLLAVDHRIGRNRGMPSADTTGLVSENRNRESEAAPSLRRIGCAATH